MKFKSSGAIFDLTERYRYLLWRVWDSSLPAITFVLLNPSTADADRLDPTNRRCLDFAIRWGHGSMYVVNVFAFRSTDPSRLRIAPEPIGQENERFVRLACHSADVVVAAWGNHGRLLKAGEKARTCLPVSVACLGLTKCGEPKHPLYLRAATALQPYDR